MGDEKISRPMIDEDGYPVEETLAKIRNWSAPFDGLMDYIREVWYFADVGYWKKDGDVYSISTAGWSGNESLIRALEANTVFWMMSWRESRRGGHYVLDLSWTHRVSENGPRDKIIPPPPAP